MKSRTAGGAGSKTRDGTARDEPAAMQNGHGSSEAVAVEPLADELHVRSIREGLGLTRRDFARLTGFSQRAIAAWEAGAPLSGPSRQRMLEMHALQQALCALAEPGGIGPWLLRPNEGFGGLKPLEVVERGEIHRLWHMLFWLESGVPS